MFFPSVEATEVNKFSVVYIYILNTKIWRKPVQGVLKGEDTTNNVVNPYKTYFL